MNPNIICTFCGQPNYSLNYNCDCRAERWTRSYRTLVHAVEPRKLEGLVRNSFQEYSFFHPRGMLQLGTLPFNDLASIDYPTVGLTPMYKLEELSRLHGGQIYVKNETHNPSGCFKDRETMMCLLNSNKRSFNNATIFSSGNAAASAAYLSEYSGHSLITFVTGDTCAEKIDFIRSHGADVIVIGDGQTSYEEGYELFSDLNADSFFSKEGYDNWSVNNPYRVEGDKTIALEIVKQFTEGEQNVQVPDYVIVPMANGSCLAGIWKGFKELRQADVISRLPQMISVGISKASPVAKAVEEHATRSPVRCDIPKSDGRDTAVGSTIVAKEGYDSINAAKAVLESGGVAIEVQKSDIKRVLVDLLEKEEECVLENNILPEPAGLTSLAAFNKLADKKSLYLSDRVVSIITGSGSKAANKLHTLLSGKPVLQQKAGHIISSKKISENNTSGRRIDVEPELEKLTGAFVSLKTQYINAQ